MHNAPKTVYLTFDDGPNEGFIEKIDFLNSKGIQAIWFCLGENLEKYPEEAVYAIKKGHWIGNHSYSHPRFCDIDLAEARSELERTDAIIDYLYSKAGVPRPIKVFRFPYLNNGSHDEYGQCDWNDSHVKAIQEQLKKLGYKQPRFDRIQYEWFKRAGFDRCLNVDCTYDTFDWCLEEGQEQFGYRDLETVLGRMDEEVPGQGRGLNHRHSNEIVMMHAWIPFKAFTVLIDKMFAKALCFALPHPFEIKIRPVEPEQYRSVHIFQCEYLDQESYDEFVERVAANPGLYLAAFAGGELAGICYGHPSRRQQASVNLQGIAVSLDPAKNFARQGIGSRLIVAFEQSVRSNGYRSIGLGAADDVKVEHFYMKNGFVPTEIVAKGASGEEYERVKVTDYESGNIEREQLRRRYQPKEVIFIFEKRVN